MNPLRMLLAATLVVLISCTSAGTNPSGMTDEQVIALFDGTKTTRWQGFGTLKGDNGIPNIPNYYGLFVFKANGTAVRQWTLKEDLEKSWKDVLNEDPDWLPYQFTWKITNNTLETFHDDGGLFNKFLIKNGTIYYQDFESNFLEKNFL